MTNPAHITAELCTAPPADKARRIAISPMATHGYAVAMVNAEEAEGRDRVCERIAACVNACAGIANPVRAIVNAGEAARYAYRNLPMSPERETLLQLLREIGGDQ